MASIVALSGGTTLGGSYCAAAVETNRTKVREADRKSTRLNSSQGYISYAVFCLKKKKPPPPTQPHRHLDAPFTPPTRPPQHRHTPLLTHAIPPPIKPSLPRCTHQPP